MSSSKVNLKDYLIPLEEIILATENFSPKRYIGGGGFGKVYVGELSKRRESQTAAAIKRLDQGSYQGEHEFRNEIDMISKFHHANIISFIGYCDEGNEMIIIYEYAFNGSLDQHLQHAKKMCAITWTQRLQICLGAARGLNYLHSGLGEGSRVIHRDLKSANILLDKNMVAKICDFGLSKWGPKNQPYTHLNTKIGGTKFYMDPTYYESGILRKESDIYSFGVVLFEMLSGMLVYGERSIEGDKPGFLMNLVRQYDCKRVHKLIDPHMKDLMINPSFKLFIQIAYGCISFNILERPTMDAIVLKLEQALNIHVLTLSTYVASRDMITEAFLSVDPLYLKFPIELNKESLCFFHLTNNTDQRIAFKVLTTKAAKYFVRPNCGFILPRSVCNVTVAMRAQKVAPLDLCCEDKFKVQATIALDKVIDSALNGATDMDIITNMLNQEESKFVMEYVLWVEYYIPFNLPLGVLEETEEDLEEPEEDSEEPEEDSEEPEKDTEEPEKDSEEPEKDSKEPEKDSDEPENDAEKLEEDSSLRGKEGSQNPSWLYALQVFCFCCSCLFPSY